MTFAQFEIYIYGVKANKKVAIE